MAPHAPQPGDKKISPFLNAAIGKSRVKTPHNTQSQHIVIRLSTSKK